MSRLSKLLTALCLVALIAVSLASPAALSAHNAPTNTTRLAQADIESLAALMPFDSNLFFVLRTDDDYIALLNELLQKVYDTLPQLGLPRTSLQELLDQVTQPLGGDFQTTVRAWLGDNAAFALSSLEKLSDANPNNDFEVQALLAVQITDRAKVETLFESIAMPSGYTKTSTPAFTDYEDAFQPILLRVSDDLMLLGTKAGVRSVQSRAAKLDANPEFQKALSVMPESGYNILAYADLGALVKQAAMLLPPEQWELIEQGLTRFALGATILDGRSLVLDIAVPDTSALAGIDFSQPTNPDFARFMPANTILSVQLRDLKNYYESILAALRASLAAQSGADLRLFERTLQQVEDVLRLTLRLDLEADILSWMTGDVALFVAYTPQERSLLELSLDPNLRLPFVGYDFGLLIEAADPAKAADFITNLGDFLRAALRNNRDVSVTLGEGRITLALNAPNLTTPIEIVIGANDSVLYVATGAAAAHIESGQEGLSAAAGYREATQYLLPESAQIWYMGSDAINLLGEIIAASDLGRLPSSARLEVFRRARLEGQSLAKLLSSSSISLTIKDGFQVMRAVLSLPE
jgi:hypothetical protein